MDTVTNVSILDEQIASAVSKSAQLLEVDGAVKNEKGDVYYLDICKPADKVQRMVYVGKDASGVNLPEGQYWVTVTVLEFRPNCTCPHFQTRGLDKNGKWNGLFCKHQIPFLVRKAEGNDADGKLARKWLTKVVLSGLAAYHKLDSFDQLSRLAAVANKEE